MPNEALDTIAAAASTPRHVAIIMDGNHRWARARHLPGAAGHRAGAKAVRPVAERAAELGVEALTLFAFSTENWKRPRREVSLLIELMKRLLVNDVDDLASRGISVRIIGERGRFSDDVRGLMERAEAMTAGNGGMRLNLAVSYGGRWDIAAAARRLAERVRAGELAPEAIDEDLLGAEISMADVPAPDLCIRTGGDRRISNFLLWQFAYTELYFTETYWPDFDHAALDAAVEDFACRQRRFGRRPDDG
ncbi:MAG: polyprenyl diphosphate synthase [Pseudomonadales bacterium]|jgi:undecaprenyl diphosphate synthase|nr:polyprenyl diphosphate synthase [Pseudomonadales bacterium]